MTQDENFVGEGFAVFSGRIQSLGATQARNLSAGVLNPKVFLGRWFRRSATLSNCDCVKPDRSAPLRKYWRSKPLPKDELLALKRSIAELGSIGRNINQIARAANSGDRMPNSVGAEFRAKLKICVALRDNTKALLNANLASWAAGHARDDH
jgi:hypothetical protein